MFLFEALTRRPSTARRPWKRPLTVDLLEDRLCLSPVLLVADGLGPIFTNTILKYDGLTGSFLGTFVPPGPPASLQQPDLGFTQGPDLNIYKENFNQSSVLRFDPVTGAALPAPGQTGANFVPPGSGGLKGTEG